MSSLRTVGLMLVLAASVATAQDSLRSVEGFTSGGSSLRKTIATCTIGGTLCLSLIWSFDEWWKGEASPFHFYSEGWFNDYALGMDKVGHAFTSYFYFRTYRNIMLWGGYDKSTALWLGAGTTAFFALCVEIGDGFSPFGFSYEDLLSNLTGLGYGILQTQIPVLQNFNLKWSYIPGPGDAHAQHFTQFYDDHTYWLTANMHNLLPESWQTYWPEFLQLAVGYSIAEHQTKREAVIGLDFNIEVFPVHNNELLLLQKTVNMIHLPAPAVKFAQDKEPRYYLFHLH